MTTKRIELDDKTYIEIEPLKDGSYQAAWIDPRTPDEALEFGTAPTETEIITWVADLLKKIPPFIKFSPGDNVILHTDDQFDGLIGTVDSKVDHLTHVMEPRYNIRFDHEVYIDNDPTKIEQFRVSELEHVGA